VEAASCRGKPVETVEQGAERAMEPVGEEAK